MNVQTKQTQIAMTPAMALNELKEGNTRFIHKNQATRDLIQQVEATTTGQFPFATVLSCIDSRVSAELVFDQGVGDIFSARVAGNIVNEDILGSMEFASKLAGAKLIVVLGHTSCGAVKGAVDNAELGNLTALVSKIQPAVQAIATPSDATSRTSKNLAFVDTVATENVKLVMDQIRKDSEVLNKLEENNEIKIVGAMYDVANGKVSFL